MMKPTDPSELTDVSTSSSSEETPAAPVHKVNIREVKQKTLALLTELYKTETGDVRRMAMTLLQTLYTIEEEHQVQEMNGKIQKLMHLIEEQKREQAEMEEASLAASSQDDGSHIGLFNRSRAHSEDSMDSIAETETPPTTKEEEVKEQVKEEETNDSPTASAIKENPLIKRWQEKLGNMRKPESKAETETEEATGEDDSNDSNQQAIPQWRQSMTTKMDASRERWASGWKESTTKLQQGWNKKQVVVEAKPTEEESENSSVSTEGSSPPPSPTSLDSTPAIQEEPDDLIKVFKTAFRDGIDSKQSRESLELAINVRKEKARHRWAETRAKWKWNNNNNAAQAQA